MTRLAVTADPHCDDFGSKIDAETGLNARWVDSIRTLRWVADDARERGADALIVAGDLSEARHPAPWRVAQIGEAIAAFGGRTVLLRGNHDGFRGDRSIVDTLADGRHQWTGCSRPRLLGIGGTTVAAIPYLDKLWIRTQPGFESVPDAQIFAVLAGQFLAIAAGLYAQAREHTDGPVVLVVHQGLAGGLMSDTQQAFLGDLSLVVDTRALAAIGFDAILAGHFHRHQILSTDPLVAYAGAPSRTDFGEEHQAKGYLIVDVEPGRTAMEFIETPARPFVTLTGECGYRVDDIAGAVVRCIEVEPTLDAGHLRRMLEADGAFDVQEIRMRRAEAPAIAGGLSETLSPAEAMTEYFAEDPDRDALIERGRGLLAAVA